MTDSKDEVDLSVAFKRIENYSTTWKGVETSSHVGERDKSTHRHVPIILSNVTNSVMIIDSHYIFVHNWGELHENKVNLNGASCFQPRTEGNRCPFILMIDATLRE